MSKLLCSLILVLSCSSFLAQDGEYFVAFCSKEAGSGSLGGHAFVAIGKGVPFTCSTSDKQTEVWGLYAKGSSESCKPSSISAGASFFVGELPGCLFSDIRTDVNNLMILKCDLGEYLKVLNIIEMWNNKPYQLGKQDCLTFLIETMKLFPEIKVPSRQGLENFPNRFLEAAKELNGY